MSPARPVKTVFACGHPARRVVGTVAKAGREKRNLLEGGPKKHSREKDRPLFTVFVTKSVTGSL